MSHYPDRHHPVFFLIDALAAIGVRADFAKDDRTLGCWGMVFPEFDNRVLVWLIDNRLPHEAIREDPAAKALLALGALVCHAQQSDMEPGFHPVGTMITADAAFVGYVRDEGRARLLADVGKRFKLSVNQGVFGKQATEAYCGAHVGLNIPSHYGQPYCTDINMRVFEIAACAVPLVTNDLLGLIELGFIDGKTCMTYGAHRSVTDAVQYAIDHREMRIAGRQLIKDRHTYTHRAEQVKTWLSA
jgi:hypothetical protein